VRNGGINLNYLSFSRASLAQHGYHANGEQHPERCRGSSKQYAAIERQSFPGALLNRRLENPTFTTQSVRNVVAKARKRGGAARSLIWQFTSFHKSPHLGEPKFPRMGD